MGLKAVVSSVDDLSEAVRLLYREEGEGDAKRFILDVDEAEGFSLNQPEKTTTKLSLAEKHRREAEKKANAATKKVEELEARLAELEANPPDPGDEKNGDARTKKMREKMLQEHEAEKGVLKAEIEKLGGLLNRNVIEAQALAAIAAEGGSPKLLLHEVLRRAKARVDGDRYVVEVMDAADPEALAYDGKGNPLTIAGLVSAMKADAEYAPAFRGTAGAGSGAPASTKPAGAGGASPRHRGDFKTSAEKAAWINANGMPAFAALPKAPVKAA